MKKIICKMVLPILVVSSLSGCVATYYENMSKESGIDKNLLMSSCEGIKCNYDKLKGNLEVSASDTNTLLSLAGAMYTTIEYSWVQSNNLININLYYKSLHGSWIFAKKAEVYIGKEKVATIDKSVHRELGQYNDIAQKHENIERVSDYITFELAEKIAKANHQDVTIRFYGKEGYSDVELPREHELLKVVDIAKKLMSH